MVTPAEFDILLTALPSVTVRLFVDTATGSGLRWGELTELRVADAHAASGIVTITRDVVELSSKFHPGGGRFLVKPYPESKRGRQFELDPELVSALHAHVELHGLGSTNLIFRFDTFQSAAAGRRLRVVEDLGRTEPNAAGRTYMHTLPVGLHRRTRPVPTLPRRVRGVPRVPAG